MGEIRGSQSNLYSLPPRQEASSDFRSTGRRSRARCPTPGNWHDSVSGKHRSARRPSMTRGADRPSSGLETVLSYDTAHPRGSNYVQNRAAFSIIKSHWFEFYFNSPLERHYLSACAYCAARVGYAHRSGKSTANSQQACREAVLVLGHRSGRARRTEATVRIRLEKSRLERCTELNLQRTFGPTTMWLGTCCYLLADQKTVPR